MINLKVINIFRKNLNKNVLQVGGWIQSGSTVNAEIISNNNFDWVAIDLEHGQINVERCQNIIRILNNKTTSLVRLSNPNIDNIKHALDAGAHGLIIPNLKNYRQLNDLIEHSLNPSIGKRGCGYFRANFYGRHFKEYLKQFKPIIIPMIENLDIIKDIEIICKNKYVDALFIGPYDLSSSLGCPGEFSNLKYKSLIKKIFLISKKYKKKIGIHSTSLIKSDVKKFSKKGFKLVAFATDTFFMTGYKY